MATLVGDTLLDAFARGRNDHEFFSHTFLGRGLHPSQLKWVTDAEAKLNILATSNRWGKTTVLTEMHCHAGIYKTGAEWRYMDEGLNVDLDQFTKLKYELVHSAGEWEQASFVWEDILKCINEQPNLRAFVAAQPKSKPPFVKFITGSKLMFRTLGVNASNIDGKSIYLLTIDEAGWVTDLETMMRNVLRVRTADVRGRIVIAGTMKPGISRDFYKLSVRAGAYTGVGITLDHRSDDDEGEEKGTQLDLSIVKYLKEFGINLDEYRDAFERSVREGM